MDWLFNTSEFLPRSSCGPGWTDWLMWGYVISNFAIGLCYLVISCAFVILRFTGRDPFLKPWWSVVAALFFFGCGGGHFLENTFVFWFPVYRFYTAWGWFTLASSLPAAVGVPAIILTLMRRPSYDELKVAYAKYADMQHQYESTIAGLTSTRIREFGEINDRIDGVRKELFDLLQRAT